MKTDEEPLVVQRVAASIPRAAARTTSRLVLPASAKTVPANPSTIAVTRAVLNDEAAPPLKGKKDPPQPRSEKSDHQGPSANGGWRADPG